jgi:hypothetical protein
VADGSHRLLPSHDQEPGADEFVGKPTAIAEVVGRPKMRFVPIKSDDQLDLQSLHRVRERWVMDCPSSTRNRREATLE